MPNKIGIIQVSRHTKKLQEPLKISILGAFPTIQTQSFLVAYWSDRRILD